MVHSWMGGAGEAGKKGMAFTHAFIRQTQCLLSAQHSVPGMTAATRVVLGNLISAWEGGIVEHRSPRSLQINKKSDSSKCYEKNKSMC